MVKVAVTTISLQEQPDRYTGRALFLAFSFSWPAPTGFSCPLLVQITVCSRRSDSHHLVRHLPWSYFSVPAIDVKQGWCLTNFLFPNLQLQVYPSDSALPWNGTFPSPYEPCASHTYLFHVPKEFIILWWLFHNVNCVAVGGQMPQLWGSSRVVPLLSLSDDRWYVPLPGTWSTSFYG